MGNGVNLRTLTNDGGSGVISDYGAHLLRWAPAGQPDVIWTPRTWHFEAGQPVGGGVPVCFPWFGPGFVHGGQTAKRPIHGFARLRQWALDEGAFTGARVRYVLDSERLTTGEVPWFVDEPNVRFHAAYEVCACDTLTMTLTVTNTGGEPMSYEAAMHSDLHVGDVLGARRVGLRGATYLDASEAGFPPKLQEQPSVMFGDQPVDRVYYSDAALELQDHPGEWFQEYPSGTIYYYPQAGENMETAEVIIPALETLVTIDGTLSRPVKHIQFNGITFEHTSWMRPSYQGHVTLQGGFPLLDAYKLQEPGLPEKAELENQAWITRPETAICVRGAEHIDFKHCTFRHLSSTGLDYEWAVTASSVEDCQFTDIGGTALLVGAFPDGGFETHVPFIPADVRELCSHITIRNNFISNVTNEDWGCVGIGAGYVRNMDISHNEVCHLNYSGICVGWGWTSLESGMCNNRIEANYVHHFARRLYDAGGLYTLSNQPGSVMRNNRIEHLIEAPYATNDRAFYIYLDEATDGYTMENNWCPTERFDSNRPGKKNVWKNNGPQVADSIKYKAGRIKQD